MKKQDFLKWGFTILSVVLFASCNTNDEQEVQSLDYNVTNEDKQALLFMLEEEKLARDTYSFLYTKWGINQFNNIKDSEQSHMDAIINLLQAYNVPYTLLPEGQFSVPALQDYYNLFVTNGSISSANALQIGATIEDLDIVDLEDYMNDTQNTSIISVFEKLQCGSRNHIRSFVKTITTSGATYTPQFLTVTEYNAILTTANEKCGN